MLRHWKDVAASLPLLLMVAFPSVSLAQLTAEQQLLLNALSGAQQTDMAAQNQTPSDDAAAVQNMLEQVQRGADALTKITPVFDGKNLIFDVGGTIYTFDITEKARETSEKLTNLIPTPKTPHAREEVELRVENYTTNLMEDRITWTVNDRVVEDRIGATSIRVSMGGIGETTRVLVTIFSRKHGEYYSKELLLTPGDVAVLWEANTYVPPFYKGKPLPSHKSTIKLVPFPTVLVNGDSVPPENLLYRWSRNYRNMPTLSGYGKRYAFFETAGSFLEERLRLNVSHPDSGTETERDVVITIVRPKLLLYAGSPLQGIRYESVLGKTYPLFTQETTIKGEPFFFSNEEVESGASPLRWTQNGKEIPSLYRSVVLQKPPTAGTSRVEAVIENPKRVLQNSQAAVTITYQAESL